MSGFGDHPWLSAAVVPLAWCWRIERRDGVVLGLTTHDRVLTIAGLAYRPEPGIRPSSIRQRGGLSGDSVDVTGALSSATVAADDLLLGRWNGARLTLLVADWQAAEVRHLVIAEGWLGEVTVRGAEFTAELAGRDPVLQRPLVPETSAECRAELGDRRCRVALAGRTMRARVIAVAGRQVTVDAVLGQGDFAFGELRWTDGAARGVRATIVAQEDATLLLSAVPERADLVGCRVELTQGCDKRAGTCTGRFGNIANFRGEPHLPGIDLLTRFPGG